MNGIRVDDLMRQYHSDGFKSDGRLCDVYLRGESIIYLKKYMLRFKKKKIYGEKYD